MVRPSIQTATEGYRSTGSRASPLPPCFLLKLTLYARPRWGLDRQGPCPTGNKSTYLGTPR